MKNSIPLFLIISFLFISSGKAQEPATTLFQNIRLKDGTVIKGQLVGVKDGQYIVDTENIGQIHIKISDFESITPDKSRPSSGATGLINSQPSSSGDGQAMPVMSPQMQQISQQIMADPEIMAAIKNLMEDPTALPLLQDPGVFQAAMSMDPEQAKTNPAVQKLLQHPRMQQLMNLIMRKLQLQTQPVNEN